MTGDHPNIPGVFSCVVDRSPDAQLAALRWFVSLTIIAGVRPEDLALCTVGDGQSDVLDYLRAQGVVVRPLPPVASCPPYCDPIAGALSLAATGVRSLAVLTATDVVILEDPRTIAIPPRSVALASGQDDPSIILVPGDLLPEVARTWSQCATFLGERASAAQSRGPGIPSTALTMALARAEIEIHELDGRWSVSTAGPAPAGGGSGRPAVLRYSDRVDRKGFLLPTGAADVDERITEVNAAVYQLWQEAFPSATFWEWRYRDDPDLGSGVGSRGPALREKRELLTALIGLLRPVSVLDVGCGDGAATQGIPIARYVGIDLSPTAVERARLGRPDGEFRAGTLSDNYADADLTLCLDVLIHQSAAKTYEDLVRTLCSGSGAVLLSGLQRPPGRTTAMVHFHEPLSRTIKRFAPEARIYPMRRATGITTLLIRPKGHQLPLRLRLGLSRLQLRFAVLRMKRVLWTVVRQRALEVSRPRGRRSRKSHLRLESRSQQRHSRSAPRH